MIQLVFDSMDLSVVAAAVAADLLAVATSRLLAADGEGSVVLDYLMVLLVVSFNKNKL